MKKAEVKKEKKKKAAFQPSFHKRVKRRFILCIGL